MPYTAEPRTVMAHRRLALRNTVKTTVLLATLGALVVAVAALVGGGSSTAFLVGGLLALATVGGSYWFSDRLALAAARAKVVSKEEAPQLHAVVARLAERAGMPMPRVALSPSAQPNAFATGRNPRRAVVCATAGLLEALPPAEVEAVMAHEMMHVKHRDILIGSVAAAVATAISSIAQLAMFASWSDDDEGPGPLALLATVLLAPVAATVIQLAVSRSREFQADRGAAELLGSGHALASALERIEALAARHPLAVPPAQAQAYIHNPLAELRGRRTSRVAGWFSTHPATAERVRRLRALA